MEGGLLDRAAKVSEVSYSRLIGDAVGSMGMGADISALMTGFGSNGDGDAV